MVNSACNLLTKGVAAAAACVLFAAGAAQAQPVIATFAGDGTATYSGDGGPATAAALNYPKGIALDGAGNIYIADSQNFRVRKVNAAGMINTVAGNGIDAGTGDGGLAVNASISDVTGVALDRAGNLYLTDDSSRRIRKVAPGGIITTIAGVGVQGFSGDDGPAVSATLGRAVALAFDAAGNLYFADSVNQRVRKIDVKGIITTVAGNGLDGFSGDGGPATAASLAFPVGVAVDAAGNLYIADGDNNRVRKVTTDGMISTFAGNGEAKFAGDGGQAVNASINIPSDLAFDSAGNLYIADAGNNRVREVDASGNISTVAGTADNGFAGDGGPPAQAMLNFPWGLAVDPVTGWVYVGDRANSRVRLIRQSVPVNVNISIKSTVNGASFAPGEPIAPGAIVTLFGSNLASKNGTYINAPLPESINGTAVTFNGKPAPLFFVSPGQINAQAPFDLPLGPVQIQVEEGGSVSSTTMSTVAQFSPGIFIVDYNSLTGAILHASNYALVSLNNPAVAGEALAIYATGLGPLDIAVSSGTAAPSVPPFPRTISKPLVTIGGVPATVLFSGLAPGFVGLYQLNVTVPSGLTPGMQGIQISAGGVVSNAALLAVR